MFDAKLQIYFIAPGHINFKFSKEIETNKMDLRIN